ncbi:MAG: OmpA family protein [Ignavibacteria bacterium]|nr:OmpA family protein [Ignavibacteria bacterium]
MIKFYTTLIFISFIICYQNSNSQQKENLGPNINSDKGELKPMITADGTELFFIRSTWLNGKIQSQKLWYSKKDDNGNWKKAYMLTEPFNKGNTNTIIKISTDGKEIFYNYGIFQTGKTETLRLQKINENWKIIESIKDSVEDNSQFVNSYYGWQVYSISGKVALISVNGSKDPMDRFSNIYVCKYLDNIWRKAIKLGKPINLPGGELGSFNPFLAADEKTLYFASERKNGYGNADLYVSKRLDDTWLNWSEPLNLGPEINSKNFDSYYCIDAKGEYAYFVSSNDANLEDIYRIKLPETVRPDPVVLISGKVINPSNNKPLEADISYYCLDDGKEAGFARSNPFDGSYKIVLPYGKRYSFLARINGYYSISNYLDLSVISTYKEMNFNIEMKPIEIGEVFRINNIFFDFDKATLRPESFIELDRVAKLLTENPTIDIELSGHTDNVGSDNYNNSLSLDRANSVAAYIFTKGVSSTRITTMGFGKSMPVGTNDTEEGRQLNRRVEFKILKK